MADKTLLLTRFNSSESRTTQEPAPSLDDTIERCIGSFGRPQVLQALLVSLAWAFDAQQTFISVFTDREPTWHCTGLNDTSCSSAANPCDLPVSAWAWSEPPTTSVVSEWSLACAGPVVAGLPASSFFTGCLVGGFVLATLADSSLGRKNVLFLSCLTMSLSSMLTTFSPNVWVYSGLRFVSGFGRATIGTCALVLSTELVGKRWRGQVGILGFFCFAFGFLSLPAMAYIMRGFSWRTLYLLTSIPAICYCILVHFFVHESPRWLFVRGRKEDAIKTLRSISSNNINFSISDVSIAEEERNVDMYLAMKILWAKRWAFRRLLAIMVVGFGVGLVYYGMPLNVGNLDFNIYLSVAFNATAELPSALITFFLIGRLNRCGSVLALTIVSGVGSLLCAVLIGGGELKVLQMGAELVSFFSCCTAVDVVLIYCTELFPTCVRNSALSMVRQALVLGGVFGPPLVAAGRKDEFFSFGVFAVVIAGCGLFVVCLPETKGEALCDTMEEQEYKEISSSVD